ncbi:MAG: DNA polymerase III subunit beta [Clostridia bacterium]|nr:DNA polymerase III subunit beta [Clostridia bacterium]
MHIITNVSDLMNALTTVTRAIAARSAKKIMEGVLIDASEDEITLTCTDGSLVIQSTIMATVNEPGRIVLPGRLLAELVRKLPASEVSIKSDAVYSTQIKCLTSNSRLTGMNPMEFPEMNDISDGTMISVPQNKLKDMINRVVFSISTDESRILLTGCLMEITSSEMRLVALDGFRLALQKDKRDYSESIADGMRRIVIPGRVMNELSKIISDEEATCDLIFNNTHIKAIFGNSVVSSTLLSGEYIDFRKIVPTEFKTRALVKKSVLAEAIDRAGLLAREGKSNIIKMQLMENQANITSHAEQGDVLEVIDIDLQGDPLEIAFNSKYIADVIRNIGDEDICMQFNTNVSPCVITKNGGDDYFYLILPVRVFS